MNLIHKIEKWGDSHHPGILDIIRIALGIFLFMKGLAFMQNTAYLKDVIDNQTDINLSSDLLMSLVYYVTFVHLVGGTLIALGILTRLSAILQIPVVFGAVFFVNVFDSPVNNELWYSVIALILLVVFTVIGSGPLSLDRYLELEESAG